jgi:hypothetical protein
VATLCNAHGVDCTLLPYASDVLSTTPREPADITTDGVPNNSPADSADGTHRPGGETPRQAYEPQSERDQVSLLAFRLLDSSQCSGSHAGVDEDRQILWAVAVEGYAYALGVVAEALRDAGAAREKVEREGSRCVTAQSALSPARPVRSAYSARQSANLSVLVASTLANRLKLRTVRPRRPRRSL